MLEFKKRNMRLSIFPFALSRIIHYAQNTESSLTLHQLLQADENRKSREKISEYKSFINENLKRLEQLKKRLKTYRKEIYKLFKEIKIFLDNFKHLLNRNSKLEMENLELKEENLKLKTKITEFNYSQDMLFDKKNLNITLKHDANIFNENISCGTQDSKTIQIYNSFDTNETMKINIIIALDKNDTEKLNLSLTSRLSNGKESEILRKTIFLKSQRQIKQTEENITAEQQIDKQQKTKKVTFAEDKI